MKVEPNHKFGSIKERLRLMLVDSIARKWIIISSSPIYVCGS